MATPRSIAFHTLGCKLNYAESDTLSRQLEANGFDVRLFDEVADIYVINTCSVTDFADRKCRKAVREARRHNPDASVVLIGCYAQLKPKEIASIEGVDMVLGAKEKFRLVAHLDRLNHTIPRAVVINSDIEEVSTFDEASSFGNRTRSFLKIQDGCDYKCSFCTIPQARGASRSSSIDQVVAHARQLVAWGAQEIVLTGVNIGDFGTQNGLRSKENFLMLLHALDKIEELRRLRISSIEPNLCSDEIIDFVANSVRIMPHFHMPLQSGSDEILQRMRRRYRTQLYKERVNRIRSQMPHACIGVDVIAGFPSETAQHFQSTCQFLDKLPIAYLHVFTYSERANTVARSLAGTVELSERRRRSKILRRLSERKREAFYRSHIGDQRMVLLEQSQEKDLLTGFTDNYIKIQALAGSNYPNQLIKMKLGAFDQKGRLTATPKTVVPH